MKIPSLLALVALAINFALPIFAQETTTPDPQLRQQLEAFAKKEEEAFNNNDAAAAAALFVEDAVMVTNRGPIYGREAIENNGQGMEQRGMEYDFSRPKRRPHRNEGLLVVDYCS
jgi:hypothetical protein